MEFKQNKKLKEKTKNIKKQNKTNKKLAKLRDKDDNMATLMVHIILR